MSYKKLAKYSPPNRITPVRFQRMAILVAALGFAMVPLSAQTPASGVDLTSPTLAVHAGLPQNNFPNASKDLLAMLNNAEGFASTHGIQSNRLILGGTDEGQGATPSQIISLYQKRACAVDVIVAGHTNNSLSHFTSSRTNIYTDYDFSVDEVLKNTASAPLSIGNHIVVTRMGGAIAAQTAAGVSKIIDMRPGQYPQLQAGTTYLMFLTRIPASGGFVAYDPFSTLFDNEGVWTIPRTAYSSMSIPDFARGTLETSVPGWLSSCGQ